MASFIRREADYAIRIVAYMAGRTGRVKIVEICDRLYLSKPIVIKIVQMLKRADIIESKTGKDGGLLLIADPQQLSIYDVLQAMDNRSTVNACVNDEEVCQLKSICKVSQYLTGVQSDLIARLRDTRMADFVFEEPDLGTVRDGSSH